MSATRWERVRTELRSVRSRVLATTIGFLAVALLAVGGITHYLRLVDVDESVRQDIVQEAGELQRLAQRGPLGPDASPSEDLNAPAEEAFTDLPQLFYTFMTTTVPGEYESIIALVAGEPAFEHADRSRFQLDDPATLAAVTDRARPGQTVVFDHEQDGRELRLGVISVVLDEDPRQGYLVVGFDMSAQRRLVLDSLWRYLGIAALTTVVAGLVAYVLVGRVTAPITRLRRATERISPEDLGQRVPVTQQDSDVGQLAVNFNGMLSRIEAAFVQQRQFLDDAAHRAAHPLDDPARQPRADGRARPRRRRGDPVDAPRRDRADEPPRGGPAAAREGPARGLHPPRPPLRPRVARGHDGPAARAGGPALGARGPGRGAGRGRCAAAHPGGRAARRQRGEVLRSGGRRGPRRGLGHRTRRARRGRPRALPRGVGPGHRRGGGPGGPAADLRALRPGRDRAHRRGLRARPRDRGRHRPRPRRDRGTALEPRSRAEFTLRLPESPPAAAPIPAIGPAEIPAAPRK